MLILYEMLHTCSTMHTQRRCKLRILSTDASGCFFIDVTFIAVAEISITGDIFSKAIINSVSLTCFSFIQFYSELTSLYISTPYTYQV